MGKRIGFLFNRFIEHLKKYSLFITWFQNAGDKVHHLIHVLKDLHRRTYFCPINLKNVILNKPRLQFLL